MPRGKVDSETLNAINALGTNSASSDKDAKKAYEKNAKLENDIKVMYLKKYHKLEKDLTEDDLKEIDRLQVNYEKRKNKRNIKDLKEYWALQFEYGDTFGERFGASLKTAAANALSHLTGQLSKGVEDYLGAYSQYFSVIETRLLGSGKSFQSTSKIISNALNGSTAVSQLQVLQKLNEYVQQGIAYNVEQRAFLGTISDKIATTFEANNKTLLQLVKIQQADSTAARLGMESSLNKFFNGMFKDTSYLSGLSDSISASILGANSQLSRDGSVAFEYVVQKWLGSMSSVGMSDSTIQSIAQGLNALGTGDVNSLASNTALQNLLVMASNNAGLDYSSLLTGGLNANTANQLLEGVVKYGQQIASSNNQVVKSQYANLFGMTVSDLTSLLNLSSQDLVNISNNMLTYSGAISETAKQLSTVNNRVMLKERIDNAFSNVFSSIGEGIANSAALYTTYMVADLVESFTGGIGIPTISIMGNSVELNSTVEGLVKTGVIGISALTKVGSILSALTGNNRLSLDNWGAETTTGRGRGLATTLADVNVGKTVSNTAYIGNSDESDFYAGSVTAAQDSAKETVTGTEEDKSSKMADKIVDSIDPNVTAILDILKDWRDYGIEIRSSGLGSILGGLK